MTLICQERPLSAEARRVSFEGRETTRKEARRSIDAETEADASRDREFSQAISPLLDRLRVVARRVVGDDGLAQDAVQEAVLGLWMEPGKPERHHAWLVRAVTYRGLHLARGQSRRRKHEQRAGSLRSEASDRDNPVRAAESRETGRLVLRLLEQLTEDQRSILRMCLMDELDYRTIAERLDIPIGTVRSRLNRARKALGSLLAQKLDIGLDGRSTWPNGTPGRSLETQRTSRPSSFSYSHSGSDNA